MALHDHAIVGYAEAPIVQQSTVDIWELCADLQDEILTKTGVGRGEIDGLIMSASFTGLGNAMWSQATAEQLALQVDFCQLVDIGGCSPTATIARATAAIDAGLCGVVLCLFADTPVAARSTYVRNYQQQWATPSGYLGPPAAFGLLTSRYEHLHGLDYRALGKLAVTQRDHALLNDLGCAKLRVPLTVEDYLASRMICEPVRLLDSVMPCDGGSALLMMSAKEAERRGFTKVAVPVGYGERTNHEVYLPLSDPTQTGHSVAGARAFRQAGMTPADVASFHPYDDFLIAILMQLEMLGFCGHGQGSAFIAEHDFHFTGDLPLNTSGGQMSAGQAGLAGGATNLVEAVRQLFGEAGDRQVRDTRNALVTGIGGIPYGRNWNSSVALLLRSDG